MESPDYDCYCCYCIETTTRVHNAKYVPANRVNAPHIHSFILRIYECHMCSYTIGHRPILHTVRYVTSRYCGVPVRRRNGDLGTNQGWNMGPTVCSVSREHHISERQ